MFDLLFEYVSGGQVLLTLLVIMVAYALVGPRYRMWITRRSRIAHILQMEKKWNSKVLTMIHRRESIAFLGMPFRQFIDVEDAESILRAIREAKDRPIDLIIHSPGGELHASIQIARALKNHPARTRAIIPHYSMSGGTLIALATDEIIMDKDAVIGPIDPQIGDMLRGTFPAPSWIEVAEQKGDKADDATLVISDISKKALELMRIVAEEMLKDRFKDKDDLERIVNNLVSGKMIHCYPISASEAKSLGLNIKTDFPDEVHEFMNLYRSAKRSVEYLP
ncbi:MAG: ATP-dependent Clp protease proteolytic subunit [Halobacteriota archaeon]|nr:ATP-dependent Clp protease proteolytic subunit [Halobacteriota archaeon]